MKKFPRYIPCAVFACAAALSGPRADAATRAYDGFNYPAGALLDNQNGGSGFASPWDEPVVMVEARNRNLPAETIAAGSLAFGPLVTAGNRVRTGGEFSFDGRELSLNPTTLYASVLLRRDTDGNGGEYGIDDYGGLEIDGTTESILLGDSADNEKYSIEISGVGFPASSASEVVTGQTAFLVARINFTAGAEDIRLYVNPAPGRPEPSVASVSRTDLDLGSLTGIGISTGTNATWSVDEIRLGDTFADVTPATFVPRQGDADLDGDVDFADFLILYDHFEIGTTWVEGDFDGDAQVTFADFQALERNFGGGPGAGAVAAFAAAHVPEPAALALVFVAGLTLSRRRR